MFKCEANGLGEDCYAMPYIKMILDKNGRDLAERNFDFHLLKIFDFLTSWLQMFKCEANGLGEDCYAMPYIKMILDKNGRDLAERNFDFHLLKIFDFLTSWLQMFKCEANGLGEDCYAMPYIKMILDKNGRDLAERNFDFHLLKIFDFLTSWLQMFKCEANGLGEDCYAMPYIKMILDKNGRDLAERNFDFHLLKIFDFLTSWLQMFKCEANGLGEDCYAMPYIKMILDKNGRDLAERNFDFHLLKIFDFLTSWLQMFKCEANGLGEDCYAMPYIKMILDKNGRDLAERNFDFHLLKIFDFLTSWLQMFKCEANGLGEDCYAMPYIKMILDKNGRDLQERNFDFHLLKIFDFLTSWLQMFKCEANGLGEDCYAMPYIKMILDKNGRDLAERNFDFLLLKIFDFLTSWLQMFKCEANGLGEDCYAMPYIKMILDKNGRDLPERNFDFHLLKIFDFLTSWLQMFKCEANGLGEDCYAMPYIKMILDKNGRDLAERNFDFHLLKIFDFLTSWLQMFKCEANGLGEDCYAMPYIKMILDKNGRDLAERNFDFHLLKIFDFLTSWLQMFKCEANGLGEDCYAMPYIKMILDKNGRDLQERNFDFHLLKIFDFLTSWLQMFKCEANGLGEDCYAMPYIKMILDKNGRDLAERNFDFHLLKIFDFLTSWLQMFKCEANGLGED